MDMEIDYGAPPELFIPKGKSRARRLCAGALATDGRSACPKEAT
jgi:hypothetical protein